MKAFNERERERERERARERDYIQVEYKTMKCQTMLRLFNSQPKLCHAEATTPFLNHHFLPEVSHSTASNEAIIFFLYSICQTTTKLGSALSSTECCTFARNIMGANLIRVAVLSL